MSAREMARAWPAVLTLTLAVALSGCGGSGGADAGDGEPVATNQVDLPRSYKFAPERITVDAGAEVTWTNNDQFTHNVVVREPEEIDVGTMAPGESVSHAFEAPGTYRYQCTLHPKDMNGEVQVS